MTAVKLIGAAVAVLFACLAGDISLDGLRERIVLLTELERFGKKAAVMISEYKMTLSAMRSETDTPALDGCGFYDRLECGSIGDDALPHLTADEREAVASFVCGFGKSFADEQASLCRSFSEKMAAALKRAKSEYETKSKIMRTVPPLGVMSLLILLF